MNIEEEVVKYNIKRNSIKLEEQKRLSDLYYEFKKNMFPLIPIKVSDIFTYKKDHGYTRNGEIITVKVAEVILTEDALVVINCFVKNLNGYYGKRKEILTILKLSDINKEKIYTKFGELLTRQINDL